MKSEIKDKRKEKLKWDNVKPVDKKGWLWVVGILNAVSELKSLGRGNGTAHQK